MTKRKTVIQNVIEELETTLVNHIRLNDDEKFILKDVVKLLKSKLTEEKQDLIEAYDKGIKDICTKDGLFNGIKFYLETFENEKRKI